MKKKKNILPSLTYLEHLLDAIAHIKKYTVDMGEATFLNHEMAQDAVIRNIEILGEAANNIRQYYPKLAKQYSDIPWDDIYLMRNKITHDYHTIDFEMVWKVIENDLPLLEHQIKEIYQNHFSD